MNHAEVKEALALAISQDEEIFRLGKENFGRGVEVIVNRYGAKGFPGEADSPYIYIFSDGENESGNVEEDTFDMMVFVGGVDSNYVPREEVRSERSSEANGLVVSGIEKAIESIRERVVAIAKCGHFGARFRSVTRYESSTLNYPLEWAEARLSFYEPAVIK